MDKQWVPGLSSGGRSLGMRVHSILYTTHVHTITSVADAHDL